MNKKRYILFIMIFAIFLVSCTDSKMMSESQIVQNEHEMYIDTDEIDTNETENTPNESEEVSSLILDDFVNVEINQYSEQIYIELAENRIENATKYRIYLDDVKMNEYDWTFNSGLSIDIDEFFSNPVTLKIDILDMDDNQLATYELKNIIILNFSNEEALDNTEIYKQAETIIILGQGDINSEDLSFLCNIAGLSSIFIVPNGREAITEIDLSQIGAMEDLEYMDVDCLAVTGTEALNHMENLTYLDFNETMIDAESFSIDMPNLVVLSTKYFSRFDYLPSLKELTLTDDSMMGFKDQYAGQLERLTFESCSDMDNVDFIKEFSQLKSLSLGSGSLTDISGIIGLTNLENLAIGCGNLEMLPDLSGLSALETLDLNVYPIKNLKNIDALPHLKALELWGGDNMSLFEVYDLSFLNNLNELEELRLYYFNLLEDIGAVENMPKLKELAFYYCHNIKDINALNSLTDLKKLTITACDEISDISPLENLENLEYLSISDISPLILLDENDNYGVSDNFITKLDELGNIKSLKYLAMYNPIASDGYIELDINPLVNAENLLWLTIYDEKSLYNLSPVKSFTKLEYLNIKGCDNIEDVSFLSDIEGLIVSY